MGKNDYAGFIRRSGIHLANMQHRESFVELGYHRHKLEVVLRCHGVEYVNDSKSCNVNGTWFALSETTRPVVWIAGGITTGQPDWEALRPLMKQVRGMVLLGHSGITDGMAAFFLPLVPVIIRCGSMPEAVAAARRLAVPGDTVLLSPACASFDLFENYEHRGNEFERFVKNVIA